MSFQDHPTSFDHANTRGAGKSLVRPGRKQARKHVRDAHDFNNIETRAVIKFFFSARQDAEGNSRHSDRNFLACFLPGLAKDLSAPCNSDEEDELFSSLLLNSPRPLLISSHLLLTTLANSLVSKVLSQYSPDRIQPCTTAGKHHTSIFRILYGVGN